MIVEGVLDPGLVIKALIDLDFLQTTCPTRVVRNEPVVTILAFDSPSVGVRLGMPIKPCS
jgi:hypothetical protein